MHMNISLLSLSQIYIYVYKLLQRSVKLIHPFLFKGSFVCVCLCQYVYAQGDQERTMGVLFPVTLPPFLGSQESLSELKLHFLG